MSARSKGLWIASPWWRVPQGRENFRDFDMSPHFNPFETSIAPFATGMMRRSSFGGKGAVQIAKRGHDGLVHVNLRPKASELPELHKQFVRRDNL